MLILEIFKMKKIEIIFFVIVILVILWGIQWMFHGFPVGS